METTIPYQNGLVLGRSVDIRTIQPGYMLKKEIQPIEEAHNVMTTEYRFVEPLKDACDVLRIAPEHALKVKADIVKNDTLKLCLERLGRKDSVTLVLKTSFLKESLKEYQAGKGSLGLVQSNLLILDDYHNIETLG